MKVHASTVIRTALIALLLMLVPLVMPGTSMAASGSITACTGCHENPPLDDNATPRNLTTFRFAGNHTTHADTGNCNKCHNSIGATEYNHNFKSQVAGVNYINMTSVINKSIKSAAKYGSTKIIAQTSTPAFTTCANVNCHFETTTPSWGQATTWNSTKTAGGGQNCSQCHATTALSSSKHAQHLTALGSNLASCVKCHPDYDTLTSAAAFQHATSAVRAINVNFAAAPNSGAGTYTGGRTGQGYLPSQSAGGTGTCSATYCHSSGKLGVVVATVEPTAPVWTGAALDCKGCHGAKPNGTAGVAFTSTAGEPNYTSGGSGTATANSHLTHVGTVLATAQTSCQMCHRLTTANGTSILAGSVDHIDKGRDARLKRPNSFTTFSGAYVSATKTCSATYCHGGGTPIWGGNKLACNNCHSALSTDAGFTNNAHKLHVSTAVQARFDVVSGNISTTTVYRFGCATCHDPGNAGVAHGQGAVSAVQAGNVFFRYTTVGKSSAANPYNAGGSATGADSTSYNWTSGGSTTCNSTYCHSNGQKTGFAAGTAVTWNTSTSSGSCTICHKGAETGSTLSGKHLMHLNKVSNASLGNTMSCMECHVATMNTANNVSISNKSKHINKMVNYSGPKAARSGWNGTTCSTYCHSNGADGTAFAYASINWASGTITNCKACHGSGSGASFFTSKFGEPNYRNSSTVARDKFNSHSTAGHIATGSACYKCHNQTVKNAVLTIASSATGFASATSRHLNKVSDVNLNTADAGIGATASYDAATRRCSNVVCHSSVTVRWGAKLDCDSCHARASLSGAHNRHTAAYRAITVYSNMTANKTTGTDTSGALGAWTNYGFGCSVCHPLLGTTHGNSTVDIALSSADNGGVGIGTMKTKSASANRIGSGVTSTCASVYCHSDGKSTFITTSAWNTTYTAANRCTSCHGNSPADTSHTMHDVGIHYDSLKADGANSNGLMPTNGAVGVSAAHGDPAQSTTISCYICHNATISGATAASRYNKYQTVCNTCHSGDADAAKNIFITGLSSHVNGTVNVQLAGVTIKTKAQLRAASFSNYTGNATDNGWSPTSRVYKTGAASFDTSKRALNAGTAGYNSGTQDCTNIVCHTGRLNPEPVNWVTHRGTGCTLCHNAL